MNTDDKKAIYEAAADSLAEMGYVADAVEMLGKGYDEEQQISDPSDLRKWRIELPNLYDDADLDPYEFRLLAHYKRVGVCTEGTITTGKKTKMSPAQVSIKRQSLADKGFIQLLEVPLSDGSKYFSYRIVVVDMWEKNFKKYSTHSRGKYPPSHDKYPLHSVKQRKNHVKKEPPEKKKREATPPPAEVTLFHALTGRYPAKPSFETVVDAVQKIKARLGRDVLLDDLRPFLTAWTDKNWNPLNLAWLKEWAVAGTVPTYQKGQTNYANRQPVNSVSPEQDAALREQGRRIMEQRRQAREQRPNV